MSISIILLNAFPDKKIKSFGNKYLLKIDNDRCLIDYNIEILKKIYKNPEIIIVGGFDSKKLYKYIKSNKKYKNIKYIEHSYGECDSIGKSIYDSISYATNESILYISSSNIIRKDIINYKYTGVSYAMTFNNLKNTQVGCIIDQNNKIINCHYGLPNELCEILYIDKADVPKFKKLISDTKNIQKLFMFEMINLCIDNNIDIYSNNIKNTNIYIIDSNAKIKNLKKNIYV